ncbi:radical SAM family heme chaperone HemW [Butyrivibrio sp. AE3004]|uniref:radical SAM family heme chaperone HemW n=1 Tax=Butyrivibrio sp. AE3004 TaxID=1506994 RepID=UPI00068F8B89|nr:radical SAM family heme chaperone HemW [Butyrivibrio sp. AE3004]
MTSLGIYIHIPFCLQKCLYCDFLSFLEGRKQQALYFDALKKEIAESAPECSEYEVVSVFFGGGTPTSVAPNFIEDVMRLVREKYRLAKNAEITIECNPGTADFEALKIYRKSGINRISIGLQSAKDEELKRLGRIHTLVQFEECYKNARKAGFENINVDLMSALPGQSLADWEESLNFVLSLDQKPEHISAYSLIIEEGTPFYEMYGEEKSSETGHLRVQISPLPDEDTEREMYYRTKMILGGRDYHRYEISNYATDGYECIHNKRYWQGGDYIGFGLGAASLMKGIRYNNTRDFRKYLDALLKTKQTDEGCMTTSLIREDARILDMKSQMEEFMFLGLRMIEGVSISNFKNRFGRNIEEIYADVIKELTDKDLMEKKDDMLRLTSRGIDISNYCMAKFLIDDE